MKARGPRTSSYTLRVPFRLAAVGGVQKLQLPDGKTLNVTISRRRRGTGSSLRLKGQGGPRLQRAGPAGDAYIELHIEPDAHFVRKGRDNVHLEVPVTLTEAVPGGEDRGARR